MIVKDAEGHLAKTLESLPLDIFSRKIIVDTGSADGTEYIARKYGELYHYVDPDPVEIDGKEYLSDFSAARNFAYEQCTAEFVFWIDSDDILTNARAMRKYWREVVCSNQVDLVGVWYDYDHDESGNCVLTQVRDRISRRESFVWRSPIHEVLCAIKQYRGLMVPPETFKVVHDRDTATSDFQGRRNLAVSKKFVDSKNGDVEPRQWLNMGNSLLGLKEWDKAVACYEKYLAKSQWNDERCMVYIWASCCHRAVGKFEEATRCAMEAVRLRPDFKEPSIEMSNCMLVQKEFESALIWAERGINATENNLSYRGNPYFLSSRPHEVRMHAFMELFQYQSAIEEADLVLKDFPGNTKILAVRGVASQLLRERKAAEAFKSVESMVMLDGDPEKLQSLMKAVPRILDRCPDIQVPRPERLGDKRKSICLFCGEASRTWGYDSIEKGGVGGSETAVIRMAEVWAARGWRVEVYGFPEERQEGIHNDVYWFPWWRLDSRNHYDVFISWRSPHPVTVEPPSARKKYIWLHDVFNPLQWSDAIVNWYDRIIVLSEAHKKGMEMIPEDKFWLTRNGLDPSFYDGHKVARDRFNLVYASCPSRGLKHLLAAWPRIRDAYPKTTLDIYYGFNAIYKAVMKNSQDHRDLYKFVTEAVKQPGIEFHGMVGQRELGEAFSKASIWAYPCSWPEISCISSMQAQASGAVPVTTGYWAMSETTQHGRVCGGVDDQIDDNPGLVEEWLDSLLDLMGDPVEQDRIRKEMMPYAQERFPWQTVAEEWLETFTSDLGVRPKSLAVVQ